MLEVRYEGGKVVLPQPHEIMPCDATGEILKVYNKELWEEKGFFFALKEKPDYVSSVPKEKLGIYIKQAMKELWELEITPTRRNIDLRLGLCQKIYWEWKNWCQVVEDKKLENIPRVYHRGGTDETIPQVVPPELRRLNWKKSQ